MFEGYGSAWGSIFTSTETRLAFGVPASAWASGYSYIDIGWSGFAANQSGSDSILAVNNYYDGTNYKYKNTGVAHNISMGPFGYPLIVQTAASGSAGANVTFTNAMVLEATGDVTFGGNVKSGVIGTGQTWQDVTGSRALGTTYTNSTGKPIHVMVGGTGTPTNIVTPTVAGVALPVHQASATGSNQKMVASFIVPAGATYSVAMGAGSIEKWVELR